jgi:hypothetical protein
MTRLFFLFCFALILHSQSFSQKVYNDGTVEYSVSLVGSNATMNEYFKNATMKLYLRGMQTRSDLKTAMGNTVTIHDNNSGSAVMLNDYGGQKILVRMNSEQYKKMNKKYENPSLENTTVTKIINGYKCVLTKIKFPDGNIMSVFISSDLKFHNSYFGIPVKLSGIPLEYESEIGGLKVVYKAVSVNTNPVAAGMFDVPTTGYREMKFEEMPKQ